MKKLILIAASILLVSTPVFAKEANRKIASLVNPEQDEKSKKKRLLP